MKTFTRNMLCSYEMDSILEINIHTQKNAAYNKIFFNKTFQINKRLEKLRLHIKSLQI